MSQFNKDNIHVHCEIHKKKKAKIRVVCHRCNYEGFALEGEPQSWDDLYGFNGKSFMKGMCFNCNKIRNAVFKFRCPGTLEERCNLECRVVGMVENGNRIIKFHVEGRIYRVPLYTIQQEPQSMLMSMVENPNWAESDGYYSIDMDYVIFEYILHWLRYQKIDHINHEDRIRVFHVADYLQLRNLADMLEDDVRIMSEIEMYERKKLEESIQIYREKYDAKILEEEKIEMEKIEKLEMERIEAERIEMEFEKLEMERSVLEADMVLKLKDEKISLQRDLDELRIERKEKEKIERKVVDDLLRKNDQLNRELHDLKYKKQRQLENGIERKKLLQKTNQDIRKEKKNLTNLQKQLQMKTKKIQQSHLENGTTPTDSDDIATPEEEAIVLERLNALIMAIDKR